MELDFEKPLLEIEQKIQELQSLNTEAEATCETGIKELTRNMEALKKEIYGGLTAWQTVLVARHPGRPQFKDYVAGMCSEFIELHGDRLFADDRTIIGGLATIDKYRVMLIGQQKGKTTEEKIEANFGMGNPEGYRKALRLMNLAEKYRIPVVTLVDTPGAYPGIDGEARGQAEAIAHNLARMSDLEVPIVTLVTGEGGSGGAIGIGMGDAVLMLSNSVYSVISPEGCASILWRDGEKKAEAAEALKLTASALLKLGIIDEIIDEPLGGAHRNAAETIAAAKACLVKHIKRLKSVKTKKLVTHRFDKFRGMGRQKS